MTSQNLKLMGVQMCGFVSGCTVVRTRKRVCRTEGESNRTNTFRSNEVGHDEVTNLIA